ncbi:MAG: ABC transporter ATP-binding protein [Syntrophales bacterium]|nr:ABC transporter ATP-binding protein [Syntrophales bacterium]
MNDPVIRVENLGKRYRIGTARERNRTFREAITDMFASPWRFMKSALRKTPAPNEESSDHIWALKNVSFEVNRGEVVGIIGRNGAGKSTLLKILSRITEPTEGRIVMRGRVGSLLEVGTGFHSELTGEENIYLSGTILGMRSSEISRKFDEIVAFAEMEKFINTPVKFYSSGMYMRLAFAVAAHLEPEILLIDEVLAVGDAQFQKKCLGKMDDVAKGGRTVLFVSHNMGVIESLCPRTLQFDEGTLVFQGATKSVINNYLVSHQVNNSLIVDLAARNTINDSSMEIRFHSIWTETLYGELVRQFEMEQPFFICFKYIAHKAIPNALIAVRIETLSGQIIIDSWDSDSLNAEEILPGYYSVRVKVDPQDLHPGHYQISLVAAVHLIRWIDRVDGALRIEITPVSSKQVWRAERNAILARVLKWERTHHDNIATEPSLSNM